MGIHLTNYRIYKENKDLYWWLFDLWENKENNIAVFIQYIDFRQLEDKLYFLLYSKGKLKKKENGACVFWAPVFF